MNPDDLTIEQVAHKLGVSGRSVRRYIARRQLAVIRYGYRTARVTPAALERFKEKRTEKSIL